MSNEGNLVCGLIPMSDNKGEIEVRYKVPISATLNSDYPLFRGSPYQMASGTVQAVDWSGTPDSACAGCIVRLYDSSKKEVLNLPSDTAGYADVTYRKNQRYQIVASGTGFAANGSDNGVTYAFTNESATANSNGRDGASNSGIMMDTSQEDASTYTFLASFAVIKPGNVGGADRTLIEGTINPACWQAW